MGGPLTTAPAAAGDREIVALTIVRVASGLDQLRLNAWPIGYIQQAGGVWVASFGARSDRATESGQFLDYAAAVLRLLDGAQPPESSSAMDRRDFRPA
jgi:hypothetical protein